ncbi:hypothetical protein GSH19_06895 [Lactobacillus sp. S2-2]|uniref:hypothetical protein n=1 Tax=Lactobacillus sp. S2-2 TaxID=2692917 RepID=UPI001F187C28|nr:hypothetical protein [Lactobacillus sp. S2-2]MCF6515870.1 hypothetical protein [Lactobacillus sp. S2-2]
MIKDVRQRFLILVNGDNRDDMHKWTSKSNKEPIKVDCDFPSDPLFTSLMHGYMSMASLNSQIVDEFSACEEESTLTVFGKLDNK